MGARISDHKSFRFAGDKTARYLFRGAAWGPDEVAIKALSSFRDLGAHVNLTNGSQGGTLNDRIRKAIEGLPKHIKHGVIATFTLPAALYGVKTTTPSPGHLGNLRAAIASRRCARAYIGSA